MKLYTEEQVLKMLEVCRDTDLYEHILTFEDILKTETPIELPSDQEVEQIADACHPFAEQIGGDIYVAYRAFKQGLQLMRDKIQGGNNEH